MDDAAGMALDEARDVPAEVTETEGPSEGAGEDEPDEVMDVTERTVGGGVLAPSQAAIRARQGMSPVRRMDSTLATFSRTVVAARLGRL